MAAWNKQKAEHELNSLNLTHIFALKMASIISLSIVSSVAILGIFLGKNTPLSIGFLIVIGLVLGGMSFKFTHSSCL